jgi:hypothetical protein
MVFRGCPLNIQMDFYFHTVLNSKPQNLGKPFSLL